MGFFARKHKLPRFPETLIPTFRRLCDPLPVEDLPALKEDLNNCVARVRELGQENQRVNVHRLEQCAEACQFLLDEYEKFTREQQALIIGALRYFVIIDDNLPDDTFVTGFDDDAKVVNYVLEELGIEDRYIILD